MLAEPAGFRMRLWEPVGVSPARDTPEQMHYHYDDVTEAKGGLTGRYWQIRFGAKVVEADGPGDVRVTQNSFRMKERA
jgi:cytochrome oxidase Cu insertion factor (SCO1/SenC/PrrC family)